MKKKYNFPDENDQTNNLCEPMADYVTHSKLSPALTEEDMKELITGDELVEYMCQFIDELFDRK